MLYTPPATLTDKPSTLNMQGFWGNDLIVRLNLLGTDPVPVITCVASYGSGNRPYAIDMQPSVVTDGRTATIRFTGTKRYQYSGSVDVLFDGRVVMSGSLGFSRETVSSQQSGMNVNVNLSGGAVVNVTVLIGASAGGGTQSASYALAGVTTARYRHNFGQAPAATVLNSSGVEIGAAIRHIYETGSTLTNEIEITSNQPITGRLVLHA